MDIRRVAGWHWGDQQGLVPQSHGASSAFCPEPGQSQGSGTARPLFSHKALLRGAMGRGQEQQPGGPLGGPARA